MYAGEQRLVDGVTAFLRDGIAADEPTLVVLAEAKIAALREALGSDAERIQFADMGDVGANPARIIPAWRECDLVQVRTFPAGNVVRLHMHRH